MRCPNHSEILRRLLHSKLEVDKMSAQSIRPSQFIITYGPGSIIEGKNGPRLIPRPDKGLFISPLLRVEEYEISDSRISEGVLEGARVFRLPSNAELGKKEDIFIYRTKIFPEWNLCVNSGQHDGQDNDNVYILYKADQLVCPVCKEQKTKNKEAVRFIMACPDGHLDDFDWHFFIHNRKGDCDNWKWYRWVGGGSSLSNIFLNCPKCGSKSRSLEDAYRNTWQCHGRFPEREDLRDRSEWKTCDSRARIIQRQASNLRIANVLSLFTIPPRDTALHRMLDNAVIKSNFQTHNFLNFGEFADMLRMLESKYIGKDTVDAILKCSWDEITTAFRDFNKKPVSTYRELINEELGELLKASKDGAPPVSREKPSTEILFEVNRNKIKNFRDSKGREYIVTPISKLSEIAVQIAYRREIRREQSSNTPPKSVDVSFTDQNDNRWYPGMELRGEGLFISLRDGKIPALNGNRYNEWNNAFLSQIEYDTFLFRDKNFRDELHPDFVYFHTIAHSVMRYLSIDSGYSSTALRERIYIDPSGSEPRGGFLIYATQPGSDGTSGGLISMADSFQYIYNSAIHSIESCSNDPLCIEDRFIADGTKVNGSSCYACSLISETSCEHRNMWLDRGLVLEDFV